MNTRTLTMSEINQLDSLSGRQRELLTQGQCVATSGERLVRRPHDFQLARRTNIDGCEIQIRSTPAGFHVWLMLSELVLLTDCALPQQPDDEQIALLVSGYSLPVVC